MHKTAELHGEDDQLWIGWKWFEYHSRQRLESFKFFTVIYGAIVTGIFATLSSSLFMLAFALCIIAIITTLVFWQLDERNRQLIEIGELIIQTRWIDLQFRAETNPIPKAQLRHGAGIRYKQAFYVAFCLSLFFAILLFSFTFYCINYPNVVATLRGK